MPLFVMASKQDPRTRLEAKRERILALIAKDNTRAGKVFDNLGHGYAMRAYSRLKHMSSRVGDELSERLEQVEKALAELGWEDPSKPRPAPRTPTQELCHYCEVMGLNFAEELAKLYPQETTEIAQ